MTRDEITQMLQIVNADPYEAGREDGVQAMLKYNNTMDQQ